jgi:hypothetical protein
LIYSLKGTRGRELAIEHTVIESFSGRIFEDRLFGELASCIEARLEGRLPLPGQYHVVLESGSIRNRKSIPEACAKIAAWAESRADALEVGDAFTAPDHIATEVLAPWDLKVRLQRWPGRDGQVRAIRSIPEGLSAMREERIARALHHKCPKLDDASAGDRTSILILESDDLALSNYVEIAEATVHGLAARLDAPDIVCLVETDLDADVWLIKEYSDFYPDIRDPGPLAH